MKSLLIIFLMSVGLSAYTQPDIPEKFLLETKEDYDAQEDLVKDCLKWLLKQPLHKEMNKRNELNAFVMIWLSGSPTVELNIKSSAMPFLDTDEELFFTFVHGMALYKMNHPDETDEVKLHTQGLISVAEQILQSEDHVKKTKEIKKLLKVYKKGSMNSYVRELMGY